MVNLGREIETTMKNYQMEILKLKNSVAEFYWKHLTAEETGELEGRAKEII